MTSDPEPQFSPPRAALVHRPELDRYPYPPDCPFNSTRAGQARKTIVSMGMLGDAARREIAPEPATREEMEQFHESRYLDVMHTAEADCHLDTEGLRMGLGTAETPIFRGMCAYAALAAGASLTAASLLLDGEATVAFNPSGGYHHAHPARAGGFCYVNDVVLACLRLTEAGKRVAFVDIDAHHCDGVQDAFYPRGDVMVISYHESGKLLFPGTGWPQEIGEGEGRGTNVNVPMPPGLHDGAFVEAFDEVAVPLLAAYNPDVIVLELGMDCLSGDPLTHLELTNNAYADVIERVTAMGKPILATGGGGYNVENTVRGWALAWSVLTGSDAGEDDVAGLGGVLMASTEWSSGLRDPRGSVPPRRRQEVDAVMRKSVEAVRAAVFPCHGL